MPTKKWGSSSSFFLSLLRKCDYNFLINLFCFPFSPFADELSRITHVLAQGCRVLGGLLWPCFHHLFAHNVCFGSLWSCGPSRTVYLHILSFSIGASWAMDPSLYPRLILSSSPTKNWDLINEILEKRKGTQRFVYKVNKFYKVKSWRCPENWSCSLPMSSRYCTRESETNRNELNYPYGHLELHSQCLCLIKLEHDKNRLFFCSRATKLDTRQRHCGWRLLSSHRSVSSSSVSIINY